MNILVTVVVPVEFNTEPKIPITIIILARGLLNVISLFSYNSDDRKQPKEQQFTHPVNVKVRTRIQGTLPVSDFLALHTLTIEQE
jgi:hypothetical protein